MSIRTLDIENRDTLRIFDRFMVDDTLPKFKKPEPADELPSTSLIDMGSSTAGTTNFTLNDSAWAVMDGGPVLKSLNVRGRRLAWLLRLLVPLLWWRRPTPTRSCATRTSACSANWTRCAASVSRLR